MIVIHWKEFTGCCTIVIVLITISAFYSYRVNANRDSDDPEKKDFAPYSPWLVPFVLPLLALIDIPFLILASLVFGLVLLLFPLSLLLFRTPFLIKWILKHAQKTGNKMLKINTALLRLTGLYTPVNQH